MAVTGKQDQTTNNKKRQEKKEPGKKDAAAKKSQVKPYKKPKEMKKDPAKEAAAAKDKKDTKKEAVKKDLTVKKAERINRLEQSKSFFRGAWGELKKVHWPTRREVVIYTVVVVVAVIIVGIMIWLFDSALSSVLRLIV